ncbi:MAG: hypothetical protein M1820_005297 [Bogoriella megaspora]|nr:MAG: hypothetical protein M1820_005297 [Bogoriella megaspora]
MPAKRNLGPVIDPPDTKIRRVDDEQPAADFSSPVKERLLKSQRTGQACDRCKVRKIRCDGRPGGCSPCVQNNTECKTTDRITGRATQRGYTEGLEHELHTLRQSVHDLQRQLRDAGIEPKTTTTSGYTPPGGAASQDTWQSTGHTEASLWAAGQAMKNEYQYNNSITDSSEPKGSGPTTHSRVSLPTFRSGLVGDNYLGVSSSTSELSSMGATSLSVFGMEINLNDFIPADTDDAASPLSYHEFLACATGSRPQFANIALPERYEDCRQYAIWWLKSINPFQALLHKPDFLRLIDKVYNEGYRPTAAEDVMIHMMLAMLKFQYAARNADQAFLEDANAHYRHSVCRFPELSQGHGIEEVQATAMICAHMRFFPKPGAAWVVTTTTLMWAVEIGLHRSIKAWSHGTQKLSVVEIETRKRVFWFLLMIQVNLGGRLGRPMPLRLDDIDVELPEPMNDNLPDEPPKCSFKLAIQSFRVASLFLQMYSTVYSVRSSSKSYEPAVRNLERELKQLSEQAPPELQDPTKAMNEDRLFSHYIKLWEHEINLSIHHPALSRSSNQEFLNENLDQCLHAASGMLHHAYQLHLMKSLDTAWISVTTHVAAIFTTLFSWAQRQSGMNTEDLKKLRKDMEQWLEIIGDAGVFMGSGTRLQEALRSIIDTTLASFDQQLAPKAASAARVELAPPEQTDVKHPAETYDNPHAFNAPYSTTANRTNLPQSSNTALYPPNVPRNSSIDQSQSTYNNPAVRSAQFSYPEPAVNLSPYPGNVSSDFEAHPYVATPTIPSESDLAHATRIANAAASASNQANPAASPHPQAHTTPNAPNDPSYIYQPPSASYAPPTPQRHNSVPQAHMPHLSHPQTGGLAAWRSFTESIAFDPSISASGTGLPASADGTRAAPREGMDYHAVSAAALMELGQRQSAGASAGGNAGGGAPAAGRASSMVGSSMGLPGQPQPQVPTPTPQQPGQQIWPLITYHLGPGEGGP